MILTCFTETGEAPRLMVSVPTQRDYNRISRVILKLEALEGKCTYFYPIRIRTPSRSPSMPNYCRGRVCLEVAVAIGRELLSPLRPPIDRAARD